MNKPLPLLLCLLAALTLGSITKCHRDGLRRAQRPLDEATSKTAR